MQDFRFAQPEFLLLLLGIPVLAYLSKRFTARANEILREFINTDNLSTLIKGNTTGIWFQRFFLLGLFFSLIALSRPQANPEIEELPGASLDIFVLLDVSQSMDAEDMAPSRLKKAKRSIDTLLEQLSGDRVGLIAFAGSAVTVSPLTADYEVLRTFLEQVDSTLIQNQGTNFEVALLEAQNAMKRGAENQGSAGPRSNIFIVMSDGEDHQTSDLGIVKEIRESGGVVFSIAYGTESGAKIPIRDNKGYLKGEKRDALGNTVITKVQTKNLQEIAREGGGEFYYSTSAEQEIPDILKRIQGMDRNEAAIMKAKIYQEYFIYPLTLAFLCFMAPFYGALFPSSKKALSAWMVSLFLLDAPQAEAGLRDWFKNKDKKISEESQSLAQEGKTEEAAQRLKESLAENPDDPTLNFNLGTYLVQSKQKEEGRKQLERLSETSSSISPLAHFNLAGSYAQEGKAGLARKHYAQALQQLATKPQLSADEEQLIAMTRKNLAHLQQSEKSQQQNQNSQGSEGEDKKENQDKSENKEKSDSSKSQGEDKEKNQDKENKDDKKDKEQEDKEEKKEEEKDSKEQDKEGNNPEQESPPPPAKRQKQDFQERDSMKEEDAKRILEALRQREGNLQRKFLRKKEEKGRNEEDNTRDW